MQSIKTIIFDLGGVIINLYVERTIVAFSEMSGLSQNEVEEAYLSAEFFQLYEKGLISDAEFRERLKADFNLNATDEEIDKAWNAMLGEIQHDRIEAIKDLMQNYKCIVLSNTNAIHERAFHKILFDSFSYKSLHDLFHEVYFSHELKQRKPDHDIYHNVLQLSKTEPVASLFMDDSKVNLKAAAELGIETLHIPRNGGFTSRLQNKLFTL